MIKLFDRKFVSKNRSGFTLLEVMIAMVIAFVGLLSLSMMQIHAIKGNSMGNKATQAVFLAQDMIERIKDGNMVDEGTFGFIDMSDSHNDMVRESGLLSGIDERREAGGPFTLQWKVVSNTDWSRRVVVDVSWYSVAGLTRNVGLTSASRGEGN